VRVLTAARVAVSADRTADWLAVIEVLARRLAARGQHLWIFRSAEAPGVFLEFTEGQDGATHRAQGPADLEEANLEARLRGLAEYDPLTSVEQWIEVPFNDP